MCIWAGGRGEGQPWRQLLTVAETEIQIEMEIKTYLLLPLLLLCVSLSVCAQHFTTPVGY